jgi:hypothetical protein
MNDDDNWQDVAEALFGGGEAPSPVEETPEPDYIPTYKEKMKGRRFSRGERVHRWLEAHPFVWAFLIVILILAVFAIPLGLVVMAYHNQMSNTPCQEMLNWAIESIPARCLSELSEMKPR